MGKRNLNGKTHGGFVQRFDKRTIEGRALGQIEAALVTALGGDPSPQQLLIVQRVSIKALRCALLEKELVRTGCRLSRSTEKQYLAFSRSMREDLRTLGLKRQSKPVQGLASYIRDNYA